MNRWLMLAVVAVISSRSVATAGPGVTTHYRDGVLRVSLEGSYASSQYRVARADALAGEYRPFATDWTLCTGDCFVADPEVTPGRIYYYRFEVQSTGGGVQTFGPYAVQVPDTPLDVRVTPNPTRGPVTVSVSLPGSARREAPLAVQARVLDLQGRTLRLLHSGALARGTTSLAWDGRDGEGRAATPGLYFVRVTTPIGTTTSRLVRIH